MDFIVVLNDVNQETPLIYMWEIHKPNGEIFGRYVGKSKDSERPLKRYKMNVTNLLAGKPYHNIKKPEGYREIHKKLAEAVADNGNYSITLTFLCNVLNEQNINDIERYWIKEKNCGGGECWQLNG